MSQYEPDSLSEKAAIRAPITSILTRKGLTNNPQRARTELQAALDALNVTPEWLAERMKENAQAFRPISYMGKVTDWVPDHANRVKAAEQIIRIRGEYQETEQATVGLAFDISIDERRNIQIKAAARLGTWGQPYQESPDDIGQDEYPVD